MSSEDFKKFEEQFRELLATSLANQIKTFGTSPGSSSSSSSKAKTEKTNKSQQRNKKQIRSVQFDSDSEEDYEEDSTPDEYEDVKVPIKKNSIAPSSLKKSKNAITYNDDFYLTYADAYIEFTKQNPTTYHVVQYFAKLLEANGFKYLSEKENWEGSLKSEGLYYTIRNGTNVGAFAVGENWKPENGIGIIGSHIDALTAKLKPVSKKEKVDGYELLGVANYAGGLSPAWFDRDLGIGGRVLVRVEDKESTTGFKVISKLVSSAPKPIARISTLAEHFGQVAAPPYDKETKAIPVIGFNPGPDAEPTKDEKKSPVIDKHPLELLRFIAELAEVSVKDIVQLDLDLFDVQPGTKGGLRDDFIYAPRIDDRVCSFAAIHSLVESFKEGIPEGSFSQVLLYDNEEVGSNTRQGAQSNLINTLTENVIQKYIESNNTSASVGNLTKVAFANTLLLSADVNHLLNPTYKGEYLENHYPVPNKGITLSLDPNGHMVTDSVGLSIVEQIAELNGDELQRFHIKNGARSGGTIGPYISSHTGARTVDLGISQLSMHSIRAAIGVKDVGLGIKFFNGFFKYWQGVNKSFGDL
ncbi:hypothetical protein BN7_4799 [Wickerhamomyces ciferrii]|uniref:Aspartyl aminopeptidase n=1 Tax=Wickerhamomyces ciferrii (strain ATCC 14091 / BCRC 22168 / CBS 111 / JCM 3599 / NBRC 0793 / NRRL Y-1031 F-60-10) TaxID=1206466 RepID=K0KVQ5_WICCF|nr:uncharacterized protein BN7_4799 [Wickerhamomyces ciferrii]CCH45218.1 hypothetical protein BN7_4799 [Wickerhamomyces ciferrii]